MRLKSLGLLVVFGLASAAMGQLGVGPVSGVRAGLFFPTQSGSSGTWFAFGADTRFAGLKVPGLPLGAAVEGSIDYYSKGGSRNIPVLLNFRASFGKNSVALGVGPGFSRVSGGESVGLDFALSARTSLSTGPLPLFIEGRYYMASRAAVRGFAVMLGIRF